MILNGSFLGMGVYTNKQPIPVAIPYNSVSFTGNCIYDNILIKNKLLTDEEILSLNINDVYEWDNDTVLLAQFENGTVNAGILTTINNPIIKWNINRKTVGESVFKELGEIEKDKTEFIDFTAQHNKSYIYDIFPITDTEIGEPLESDEIKGDFDTWSLTDVSTGTVYLFDLEVKSNPFNNVRDITITNNYTKFPSISYGETDYIQGGISCILGEVSLNGELIQPVDYIDEFRAFINNQTEKVLKSRKGHLFYVRTHDFNEEILDDRILEQPYVISFQFTQMRLSE